MDKKKRIITIVGYTAFALLFVLLLVVRFTYGTIINVSGASMHPTFEDGGFVFATIVHEEDTFQRGDIVIVEENNIYLIKRIHAIPGESTIPNPVKGIPELTMNEDEYYILGDNWENSRDSRDFGPVSRNDIKFKFSGLYWSSAQSFVGVFIPAILLIAALTIVLIPADPKKRKNKKNENANEVTSEVNKECTEGITDETGSNKEDNLESTLVESNHSSIDI